MALFAIDRAEFIRVMKTIHNERFIIYRLVINPMSKKIVFYSFI